MNSRFADARLVSDWLIVSLLKIFCPDRFDLFVTEMNKTRGTCKITPFLWSDNQAEDAVRFRLLPHAQLAIPRRAGHMQITTRTSWLAPMINEFWMRKPKTM